MDHPRSPIRGRIEARLAEPGEVVSSGTAIITLLDLNKVYLRGFVPEGDIGGNPRVGEMALQVPVDAAARMQVGQRGEHRGACHRQEAIERLFEHGLESA